MGPPACVLEALIKNLQAVKRYPDPTNLELKSSLAAYLGVQPDSLLVGNGATEIIYFLCFLLRPRTVLVAQPTFSEYARAAEAAGARVIFCPLLPTQGFKLDVEGYCCLLDQSDMAFLCNPNNPTGNLLPYDTVYRIWQESRRRGIWLIVDESFLDFVEDWPELSLVQVAAREEKLVVLRSLTKFFALPGLRLGVGIAAPGIIKYLEERSDPWRVNILAQLAGAVAVKDKEYQIRTWEWLKVEKAYLFEGLASLPGLRPYRSETNFILVDISLSGWKSGELTNALAQHKVLVRDCSNFPVLKGRYIRVAVKERESNTILLRLLRTFLQGKGYEREHAHLSHSARGDSVE